MIPWERVDEGPVGGVDEALSLHRRGNEWSIRARGIELMNSRRSGSERALATHAAATGASGSAARVLIGGLGMGYTLAAALEAFPVAKILVAEISPSVLAWNRGPLATLANAPLDDPRAEVIVEDIAEVLQSRIEHGAEAGFGAILLDIDNGPEALSRPENGMLYTDRGIALALESLAAEGVLGLWSAGPSDRFERRLANAGCVFETHRTSPRSSGRGRARHTIWIARRPARSD
jgi:spermidine synthase